MASSYRIPITSVSDSFQMPAFAHAGDAAVDLRSTICATIDPGKRCLIPCGFAMELPEACAGLIIPRSGLALHHGITVLNAPGLIDSGYRGEIGVILHNTDSSESFTVHSGDRIAQMLIIELPSITYGKQDCISTSERGEQGFGSSGKR